MKDHTNRIGQTCTCVRNSDGYILKRDQICPEHHVPWTEPPKEAIDDGFRFIISDHVDDAYREAGWRKVTPLALDADLTERVAKELYRIASYDVNTWSDLAPMIQVPWIVDAKSIIRLIREG